MRRHRRPATVSSTLAGKRIYWRPLKRNAVMRLALMRRPTTQELRSRTRAGCALCGADSAHQHLQERAAHQSRPTSLAWLGFVCQRWIRGTKQARCDACDTTYTDGHLYTWNLAKYARRFADFGRIRMPLPFEKRKKPLMQTLRDQLTPAKRAQVNLRRGRGIATRPKRMRRMANWARARVGLPVLQDD